MNKVLLRKRLNAKRELLSRPSETIEEIMANDGITLDKLVVELGVKSVALLMGSNSYINEQTAPNLERIFGVPASFWLNLQAQYDQERKEILEMESQLLRLENKS